MKLRKYWSKGGGRILDRTRKVTLGIFEKVSIVFILAGLLPLLLISSIFLERFEKNVNDIVLTDADIVLKSANSYVNDILSDWEVSTEQIYTKKIEDGIYLNDVLTGEYDAEKKRQNINRFLKDFEAVDGLKSVRFLENDGSFYYYVTGSVGKVVDASEMNRWKENELEHHTMSRNMILTDVHEDTYFSNMNDQVVTVKRNVFDVSGIKTIDTWLGCIYIDISEDAIAQRLTDLDLGGRSGFYIIDKNGAQIYKSENQDTIPLEVRETLAGSKEILTSEGDYYYLSRENQNGGWSGVIRIHKGDVLDKLQETERGMLLMLGISSLALILIYFLFSKRLSVPVYQLKKGMEQIQEGNLDVRVEVKSQDEIGLLADGLNQMASQLSEYIGRVYVAEIRQREAELALLKSQIKPHYLYNTLDIIRMTALASQDEQAAGMIESLTRQLRYLMGSEDMVMLEQELNNIADYFSLIRIRYEKGMELKISVSDKLKKAHLIKLVLQPIVENAVKYGLKPKKGEGKLWISARRCENILEITIMDDGVGMPTKTLLKIQKRMEGRGEAPPESGKGGVGLLNVQERIQNKYGEMYGLELQSVPGTGTIVRIRIPYIEGGAEDV